MVSVELPARRHLQLTKVWLWAVLVLALLPLLAASALSAPAAQPQPITYLPLVMRLPYRILFTSDRDGNDEIYVMSANGSHQTRLTNNPAFDGEPAWSPDGRQIA